MATQPDAVNDLLHFPLLPPNVWWANKAGSTLCMPVGDASEECLGLLALMV